VAISFICEEYAYSMPDIESYIEQKIPIKPISQELLADIIIPEKRPPKPKTTHPSKRTDGNKSRKPTSRPSTPENPQ